MVCGPLDGRDKSAIFDRRTTAFDQEPRHWFSAIRSLAFLIGRDGVRVSTVLRI